MSEYHIPVLLEESVSGLVTNPSGTYADATFGGGGHTAAILSRLLDGGSVIAFDRDIDAIANAPKDKRLTLIHNNFRFIENYARQIQAGREGAFPSASLRDPVRANAPGNAPSCPAVFDGILADLGVSSHQFDTAERGFSFRFEEAPLDMRMNKEAKLTAADVVNTYAEEELEKIFKLYGEVDNARQVAKLIVAARNGSQANIQNGNQYAIKTTGDLDRAIARALPGNAEHKALSRIYQALRIEVNGEMRSLEKFLEGAAASLKDGGRLAVITYHSLEDRMVKNFIKTGNVEGIEQKDIYGRIDTPLEAVNRKPIVPSEEEIAGNTRARSAKLRIAVRRPRV